MVSPARIAAQARHRPLHRLRHTMPLRTTSPLANLTAPPTDPLLLPGSLVHIDVKKLSNIPDDGGHRIAGRAQGNKNKQATTTRRRHSRLSWP
ncbi:hypothetical protein GCM10010116_60670 [Microbispora rosea subsp. aerata]|nr:hypothetical protein GCM10010116_60670 [Microbispora rosea subsp. aerata]